MNSSNSLLRIKFRYGAGYVDMPVGMTRVDGKQAREGDGGHLRGEMEKTFP